MAPPTCTSVKRVSQVSPYTFIDLIVARVLCVREPRFFTITDFGSRQLSGMECEVVVNFSNEWHPRQFPKSGDVVVLKRFKKLTGSRKNNSMLYFNRGQSEVMFYDHQKRVYGKHSMRRLPSAIEEFSPNSDNYRYAASLIDDWKTDPRATVRAITTEMTIREAHDRFDTTRLVTLKGKLMIKLRRYYLTDAPGWSVRLEGHEIQDALEDQLEQEDTSYVQFEYAKCQQVLINAKDKACMRVKLTDLTLMDTLNSQDRMKLERKLNPPPMLTPDQSREDIKPLNKPKSLDNLDVWEPDEDELDDLLDAVESVKKEVKFEGKLQSELYPDHHFMTPDVSTHSDPPKPVEKDSPKKTLESETGDCSPLRSDDSLDDFVAYLCNRREDPPRTPVKKTVADDLPTMVTSTPKSRGIRSPARDLPEQLLNTVKKKKVN